MMRRADRYFIQQQLGDMNLEESAFAQHPTLLGAQLESPGCEQFDSAREDIEEDGKAASALDAELDASTRLDVWLGHPQLSGAAEGTSPCVGSALM